MSTFFGPFLIGVPMIYVGTKIDSYEKQFLPRKSFFGQAIFVIGYGICWTGPINKIMKPNFLKIGKFSK